MKKNLVFGLSIILILSTHNTTPNFNRAKEAEQSKENATVLHAYEQLAYQKKNQEQTDQEKKLLELLIEGRINTNKKINMILGQDDARTDLTEEDFLDLKLRISIFKKLLKQDNKFFTCWQEQAQMQDKITDILKNKNISDETAQKEVEELIASQTECAQYINKIKEFIDRINSNNNA